VPEILDEFVQRKLMVEEDGRFLSLAMMTYEPAPEASERPSRPSEPASRHIPLAAVGSPA
jgi:hypothetical protein